MTCYYCEQILRRVGKVEWGCGGEGNCGCGCHIKPSVDKQLCRAQYLYQDPIYGEVVFTCSKRAEEHDEHCSTGDGWTFHFDEDQRKKCTVCEEHIDIFSNSKCFFCTSTLHYGCRKNVMCHFHFGDDIREWCGKCRLEDSSFYPLVIKSL